MKTICLMVINYADPNIVEIVDDFRKKVIEYLGTRLVPTDAQNLSSNGLLVTSALSKEDKEKISSFIPDDEVIHGLCFVEIDKEVAENAQDWITVKPVKQSTHN